MRKIFVLTWILMLGLVFVAGPSYAAEKFSYIDLAKIFSGYSKAKDYENVLKNQQIAYATERDKTINEIKQLQEKINSLTGKEKEAKSSELADKVNNLQERDFQKQAEFRKDQEEKTTELLKDINGVVQQFAEKEGYTMVFNSNALVYQDKKLDITDKIIDLLSAETKATKK